MLLSFIVVLRLVKEYLFVYNKSIYYWIIRC
ncbi:hypothetical protein Echvi_4640 [Echinicola vietnamensis DSM 17526]|uniref:Uncharacterized protein n=1 Tax=Echinicola vietnamensis (strain DSM 17526 / LMG 23754 / KMM 6221) TaxID=926556 RepID=L0G679_ECHVK|nr:hypothetical protein Echvi_4640 [Echinicola vietnamensis DSM 17526]